MAWSVVSEVPGKKNINADLKEAVDHVLDSQEIVAYPLEDYGGTIDQLKREVRNYCAEAVKVIKRAEVAYIVYNGEED